MSDSKQPDLIDSSLPNELKSDETTDLNMRVAPWSDDALGRKPYADFLTQYIRRKSKYPDDTGYRPFTIAIDDEWGRGKTYFVKNWIKDLQAQHPPTKVVYFDAWAADCVSDPLLSFMAELFTELDKDVALVDQFKEGAKNIPNTVRTTFSKLGAAVLPASKLLLKGAIQAAIRVDVDELGEIVSSSGEALNNTSVNSILGPGLEHLFEAALQNQSDKKKIIAEFKSSVSSLLTLLEKEQIVRLPVFVFIDELDRSRPDFSIQLLEGIKHLFDIPGLCFIVSTNIEQLSHSIRGGYGPDFDGKRYLDRLFDVRYSLPRPTSEQYAEKIFLNSTLGNRKINFAIPRTTRPFAIKPSAISVFHWISTVFKFDLRSQEKVFNILMDAATGLSEEFELQFLWLGFLVALRHTSSEDFDSIEKNNLSSTDLAELFQKLGLIDTEYELDIKLGHSHDWRTKQITLRATIEPYVRWHKEPLKDILDYMHTSGREQLLGRQLEFVHSEYNLTQVSSFGDHRPSARSSIASYFSLIRNAGFLQY